MQRDPVLKLVAYLADEWAWGAAAEDCLDAMRAEVKP